MSETDMSERDPRGEPELLVGAHYGRCLSGQRRRWPHYPRSTA